MFLEPLDVYGEIKLNLTLLQLNQAILMNLYERGYQNYQVIYCILKAINIESFMQGHSLSMRSVKIPRKHDHFKTVNFPRVGDRWKYANNATLDTEDGA